MYCLINKNGKIIFSSDNDFATHIFRLNPTFNLIFDSRYKLIGVIRSYDGKKAFRVKCSEFQECESVFIGKKSKKESGKKYLIANKDGETLGEYLDISRRSQKYLVASFSEKRLGVCDTQNKWGFIDDFGKLVIECKYDYVEDFTDGLAIVRAADKYGIIDSNGGIIAPLNYDDIYSFYDGLARVRVGEKFGYIDKKGQLKIPAIYYRSENFSELMAPVESEYGKYGYIDKEGILKIPFQFHKAYGFENGYATVSVKHEDGKEKWGLIDYNGKYIIEPEFDRIDSNDFEDRLLFRVINDRKYGLVNKEGHIVSDCVFDNISGFECGFWKTRLEGKEGLINSNGKTVVESIYDEIYELSYNVDNRFFIVKNDNKEGLINYEGNLIVPIEYDDIFSVSNFIMKAKLGNRYCLYSLDGNKLTETNILEVKSISKALLRLDTDEGYTITDDKGCLLFQNEGWVDDNCSDGMIRYKLNQKYGFFDTNINVIIKPEFDDARSFIDGYASVKNATNRYGLIDVKGNYTIEPNYDNLYPLVGDGLLENESGNPIWKGIYVYNIADKYGLITSEGKVLTDALYDYISRPGKYDELLAICINGKYGAIDKSLNIIIEPVYEDIDILGDMVAVSINGEWGFVNTDGEIVIAPQFKSYFKYGFNGEVCKVETF